MLVVLDEAYNEYLPRECGPKRSRWLSGVPNLVITRTFSKIYGLAGLRVGYAFASPRSRGSHESRAGAFQREQRRARRSDRSARGRGVRARTYAEYCAE